MKKRLNLSCTELHLGESCHSAGLCPKLGRRSNAGSQIGIHMGQGNLNTGNSAHQILGLFLIYREHHLFNRCLPSHE